MKRIIVVGSGGSGKTHLARELGRRLGLPVTHLDAVYFDQDWNPLSQDAFASAQAKLVAEPEWIIDGNHHSTLGIRLARADTVVMMDVSATSALWGVIWRQVRHGAGHHGNGIHNRLNWAVVRYLARYRTRMRPKVIAKIEQYDSDVQVVYLHSRHQTRQWLHTLDARP